MPARVHATRATIGAVAVTLLTIVHHVYGARRYGTPWRYHAIPFAGIPAALIVGSRLRLRNTIARWLFVILTIAVPVVIFGLFEGAYNHVLKDALWFGGVSPDLMQRLFPRPRYEMPNDVFFELTGVMQVVPAAIAAYSIFRFLRAETRDQAALE